MNMQDFHQRPRALLRLQALYIETLCLQNYQPSRAIAHCGTLPRPLPALTSHCGTLAVLRGKVATLAELVPAFTSF